MVQSQRFLLQNASSTEKIIFLLSIPIISLYAYLAMGIFGSLGVLAFLWFGIRTHKCIGLHDSQPQKAIRLGLWAYFWGWALMGIAIFLQSPLAFVVFSVIMFGFMVWSYLSGKKLPNRFTEQEIELIRGYGDQQEQHA